MIWWNLILFAVAFIATALLAPKPDLEDARPESLDPNNFPIASESDPVPWIIGLVLHKGPNVIWYGGFRPEAIKEKIKTGLFSSKWVIVGYKYFLSLNLGIALGPDVRLHSIIIDDVEVSDATSFYDDLDLVAEYTDLTFTISTVSWTWETHDLAEILGISTSQLDALTATGSLTYKMETHYSAELSTGGYGEGSYALRAEFTNAASQPLTVIGGNTSNWVYGENTVDIFGYVFMDIVIPNGARTIKYAGLFQPIVPIATTLAVQSRKVEIFGSLPIVTSISHDINEPELYGGLKSGGGHVGDYTFYPGSYDQVIDPDVEAAVGVGNVPAYRGISHISMPDQYIGESENLHKIEFLISRYTATIDGIHEGRVFDGSDDVNVAEAIYQILTHPWNALGRSSDKINIDSFISSAETLRNEKNGCSIIISVPKQSKSVIQELLRQCDGVLVEDSEGLLCLDLIRDDYNIETLPVFDEYDILEVTSFSKSSWADVRSQVKVTYSSRVKQSKLIAIAQNGAIANMIGGIKTAEISFPFCYDGELANKLAARELAQLSIPLFTMTIVINRSAHELRVGTPLKISWPKYGIQEAVVRVTRINFGDLSNNKIYVDVIQDSFAVSDVVIAIPEISGWVDDRPVPSSIVTYKAKEFPFFLGSRLLYPIEDGNGGAIILPIKPNIASTGFDVFSGISGDLSFYDPSEVEYPISGVLVEEYDLTSGFETGLDSTGFVVTSTFSSDIPSDATTAEIRAGEHGIMLVDNEWMSYEGVTDNLDGTFTLDNIRRALLGSQPETHDQGAEIYILATSILGDGMSSETFAEDGTIFFKILDNVGGSKKDSSLETEYSLVLQSESNRPLRPRNLTIDGNRILPKKVVTIHEVSWSPSNRNNDEVTFETDSNEIPDQTEVYDIEVWINGAEYVPMSSEETSPVSLDFSVLDSGSGEVRVTSRRTTGDLKSSLYYAVFPFIVETVISLSGDMQSGSDSLLTTGDEQSGSDLEVTSGEV